MQANKAKHQGSKHKSKAVKVLIEQVVKGFHVMCSGLFVEHATYCRRVLYCHTITVWQPGSTTDRL